MFIYYGKTFESSRAGARVVGVVCDHCGFTYYYELARIGSGAHTASYGIGSSTAPKKAEDRSESDLQQRLTMEAELVPCPQCHWISDELVKGYRLGLYRNFDKWAFAIAFAGSTVSLVAAWYIHLGTPRDHWLLPYLLVGGPATFVGTAVALLLLRGWLRSRIQPNREFPRKLVQPLGTPPALILDEITQQLKPALRCTAPADQFLDYQAGRSTFPPLCCECLAAGDETRGYPIKVTRLVAVSIPRCAVCATKARREEERVSRNFLILALLGGSVMIALMVRASIELWIILVSPLALLAATLVGIAVVAESRTSPVDVIDSDQSRGIVRLRFRNSQYAPAVAQCFDATAQPN